MYNGRTIRRGIVVVVIVVKETLKISIINCGKRSQTEREREKTSVRNDFSDKLFTFRAVYAMYSQYIYVPKLGLVIIIIISIVDRKMFSPPLGGFVCRGSWDGGRRASVMKIKGRRESGGGEYG